MRKVSRRSFLCSSVAGVTGAALATDLMSAEDVNTTAGTSKDMQSHVREITAARYAPPGCYLKDHCFVYKDQRWHLFAPLGKIGTSWEDSGSEETAEHMVSTDLVHWEHMGTAVAASHREGCFDKTMGGIAPQVIQHEGVFFMFYSGWTFPSKRPHFDMAGSRLGIGLATSRDLDHWEKPTELAKDGLGVLGTDACVARDEARERWLMYTWLWSGQTAVYESRDLWHWSPAGTALRETEMGTGPGGKGESPFVMKHPRSGKWIIFLNDGYSVSDDPLKLAPIRPYSFRSGWRQPNDGVPPSGLWGDGTNMLADDNGAGFAHEILEFHDHWYMSGIVGRDGQYKLKFTPIAWTEDSLRLAE